MKKLEITKSDLKQINLNTLQMHFKRTASSEPLEQGFPTFLTLRPHFSAGQPILTPFPKTRSDVILINHTF